MIKKKSNSQNVIIIILCILLLISIGFGVTYSYYNGKTNLVKGTITTANLSIELHDSSGKTTEFSISAPFGEEFLVPGNSLNNVELNIYNKCNQNAYMVVVYSLTAIKNDETKEEVTSQINNLPAISFQEGAIDSEIWHRLDYYSETLDKTLTCLVGMNPFEAKGDREGVYINILKPNSIKIPEQWNNVLQNCNVTISVTAYAVQSEGLTDYEDLISDGAETGGINGKCKAIAQAVLETCKVLPKQI